MSALLLAVLAASLMGSLHCAGMCGPFLALVVGTAEPRGRARLQLAYHGARLGSYALLGLAAGATGALVDLAGLLGGVRPLAAILAGATLLVIGVVTFARARGWSAATGGLPEWLASPLRRAQARALRLPPLTRAFAVGATTTLLPCGWLYAFAVTAAGTARPLSGLFIMVAFWLGTLPVLVTLGVFLRGLTGALAPRIQMLTSAALVLLGLWTLFGRVALEPFPLAQAVEARAGVQAEWGLDPLGLPDLGLPDLGTTDRAAIDVNAMGESPRAPDPSAGAACCEDESAD